MKKVMTLRNAVIIFLLILLVSQTIYATNIIYSQKELTGPGVLPFDNFFDMLDPNPESLVVPIIDNDVATKSDIYIHDGVFYKKGESKGSFSLSGYCPCNICGTGTGITASGKVARANHTISADTKVLPMGTVVILENAVGKDGQVYDGVYVVEDRGGGVKNNHIDIFRPTHDLASLVTYHGKLYGDVYIAEKYDIATTSNIS